MRHGRAPPKPREATAAAGKSADIDNNPDQEIPMEKATARATQRPWFLPPLPSAAESTVAQSAEIPVRMMNFMRDCSMRQAEMMRASMTSGAEISAKMARCKNVAEAVGLYNDWVTQQMTAWWTDIQHDLEVWSDLALHPRPGKPAEEHGHREKRAKGEEPKHAEPREANVSEPARRARAAGAH